MTTPVRPDTEVDSQDAQGLNRERFCPEVRSLRLNKAFSCVCL